MDAREKAARLRETRLAAGLELSEVERRTRLSPMVLKWIEEGQFHKLPGGLYARAYLRAYATAVGLEPQAVVRTFEDDLPRAAELMAEEPTERRWAIPARVPRRLAAGAVDGVLLAVLAALVLGVTAVVCGTPLNHIITAGGPAVAVVPGLVTLLYFVVFAGVEGRTPGARLLGLPPLPSERPVGLGEIGRRAWNVFARQASFMTLVLTIDD